MGETPQSLGVLILGAGKGTRMHSEKPKVLQPLLEEPIVYYPLRAVREAGLKNIAVLVGYGGDLVEQYLSQEWPDVDVVWQHEQLGTGHAVKSARDWWKKFDNLLVVNGDVPLVRTETLSRLVERHVRYKPQCTLLSVLVDDPTGYGRILRLADGGVRIVEQRDAEEDELAIQEINAGVYLFETAALSEVIEQITPNNDQNEYYLTEAIPLIGETEGDVEVIICEDQHELLGINSPIDLADSSMALNRRIIRWHMKAGLKCMDPSATWIGPRVEFGTDVVVEPGAQIWGASKIADGARIGAYSTLRDARIGSGTVVQGPSVISDSEVGRDAIVGPFAYLRGETKMGDRTRAGRFVEIKRSEIGEGSKVPHLTYVGDTTIGENTNVGAGTITCNYDGRRKHRTEIGSGCFIGSDTMFVAPVKMGDNASTAAGSVVTKDIPDGALAIARSRQTIIDNWSERKEIVQKQSAAKPGATSKEN